MEYAAAKSSICRQCGRYFSPFAPKPGLKLRVREEAPAAPPTSSILGKFEDFWKRQRSSVIECFECKRKQQVCGSATSTICPSCSAHIDLRDYKITSGFSRTIRTRGDVHLTGKGDLGSSSVVCRSALIEGRLRGNLHCDDTATINFAGKIPGRISARRVIVEESHKDAARVLAEAGYAPDGVSCARMMRGHASGFPGRRETLYGVGAWALG